MHTPENLKDKVIKLRLQGWTYDEIANELKCSKSTISYHINKNSKASHSPKNWKDPQTALEQLQAHKEKMGCTDCGESHPHYVLEFDHRPEFKKIANVYRVLKKYGVDKAWNEVAKCDVVCSNCHKLRTWARNSTDYSELEES